MLILLIKKKKTKNVFYNLLLKVEMLSWTRSRATLAVASGTAMTMRNQPGSGLRKA